MPALAAASPDVSIEPETAFDAQAVEAVVEAAFGPGRMAKTAERLREGRAPVAGFVARHEGARHDGAVIGSVRLWSILIGGEPALFLGPIAVNRDERNAGVGADLVAACVDRARAAGVAGVLLVGDAPYFDRFGFARARGAIMPGPVDPRRVLWLGLDGREAPQGAVRPL